MASSDRPPRPSALERLPLDILDYICQYLGPRSLASLALVSRPCCLATTPHRFPRVKFSLFSRAKFQHDLQECIDMLDRGNRFRHVRRVIIEGSVPDVDEPEPEPRSLDPPDRWWNELRDWDREIDKADDDHDRDFRTGRFNVPREPVLTPEQKQAQHDAWLPFAQFLVRLPGLTDFFYGCTDQMPACVLQVLHKCHPKIRLHACTLRLRCVRQDAHETPPALDHNEFALVTSPCLYSAHTLCANSSRPVPKFNLEVVAAMAYGWAPGLRRLSVRFQSYPRGREGLAGVPEAPWEAMLRASQRLQPTDASHSHPRAPPERRRARLEALTLSGAHDRVPGILQTWGSLIDFGAIRRFGFHCSVTVRVLNDLASLAAAGAFSSLRELHLSVVGSVADGGCGTARVDGPVSEFLTALRPLEELKLVGCYGKATLEAALRYHGQGVRKLVQFPRGLLDGGDYLIGPELIREFELRCPGLEEVFFHLPRSRGGPDEVAMYRALGRLPRLRRLRLRLDCCPPIDGPESGCDKIFRLLGNAASDEALGRAIANEIAGSADSRLEQLLIEVDTSFDVEDESIVFINRVLEYVGRRVVCSRDEARGPWWIRELVDKERMRDIHKRMYFRTPRVCREAWEKLWPKTTKDWRVDWHSFPLSGEQ